MVSRNRICFAHGCIIDSQSADGLLLCLARALGRGLSLDSGTLRAVVSWMAVVFWSPPRGGIDHSEGDTGRHQPMYDMSLHRQDNWRAPRRIIPVPASQPRKTRAAVPAEVARAPCGRSRTPGLARCPAPRRSNLTVPGRRHTVGLFRSLLGRPPADSAPGHDHWLSGGQP